MPAIQSPPATEPHLTLLLLMLPPHTYLTSYTLTFLTGSMMGLILYILAKSQKLYSLAFLPSQKIAEIATTC